MCQARLRGIMPRKKRADPNKQYRHFVMTLNTHPQTGERFPDPAWGDKYSDQLHKMVQESLECVDRTFGRSLRYRIAQLEKGSKAQQAGTDGADPIGSIGTDGAETQNNQDSFVQDSLDEQARKSGFHLQLYVETQTSIRLRTVWRSLPYAYVRPRRALRETARDYCMPDKGSPFVDLIDETVIAGPFTVGEWRPSTADESNDSPLDMATAFIVKGGSLHECARRFPQVFVRHGFGLERLWKQLNLSFQSKQ